MELGSHVSDDSFVAPAPTSTELHSRPPRNSRESRRSSDRESSKNRRQSIHNSLEQWRQNRQKQEDVLTSFRSLMEYEEEVQMERSKSRVSVEDQTLRASVRRLVRHHLFDTFIGLVVILNSVLIAMEQHYKLQNIEAPAIKVFEHLFLCVYVVELVLRLYGGGLAQLQDKALVFDLLLVSISVVDQWIMNPSQAEEIQPIVVVRVARLARLARSVRLVMLFHDLWKLVQGLLASAGIMFYTLLLICMIVFAFALVGVELITVPHMKEINPDPVIDGIIQEYFSSLGLTMLTLTQFVTLDSVGPIYRPLIKNDPFLAVYFVSALLVIGIVTMNLITAVLVNRALECAEQNKEARKMFEDKKKKKILKELRDFFRAVDEDGSGKVDLEEILGTSDEILGFIHEHIKESHLKEVFHYCDVDGDGELDIEEFCEGLYDAMTSQTPIELQRIDKRVEGLRSHVMELVSTQAEMMHKLTELGDKVHEDLSVFAEKAPAQNHKVNCIPVEPPDELCALGTPAWGKDMLIELSRLRVELRRQLSDIGPPCSGVILSESYADAFEAVPSSPRGSDGPLRSLRAYAHPKGVANELLEAEGPLLSPELSDKGIQWV